MYDKNRDGTISFRELMAVMYVMSNGTPEDNLREIFRVLVDQNIKMLFIINFTKNLYSLIEYELKIVKMILKEH
jgi:Ca2+-binding EF-hand superfamily protein